MGRICKLSYPAIERATVKDAAGKRIKGVSKKRGFIEFETKAGDVFTITSVPVSEKVANPSNLVISRQQDDKIVIHWDKSPDAVACNIYAHYGDPPDYKLIQSNSSVTMAEYTGTDMKAAKHGLLKVAAVDETGRKSSGATVPVVYK